MALPTGAQAPGLVALNGRTETLPPPSDTAIEAAVLGAMMLESDGLTMALAQLKDDSKVFYQPSHQFVFEAISTLYKTGKSVDTLTVTNELRRKNQLDRCGGMGGVAALTMNIHSAAHMETHCKELIEFYIKRRLAQIGHVFLAKAYAHSSDALALIDEAQKVINGLHATMQMRAASSVGELYHETIDEIVQAASAGGGITGVPTGLKAVDKVTGGWQPQDLIIIAARPGMGKTSFAMSVALHAQKMGKPGVLFSLEMGQKQLVKKAIASESGYSTNQLMRGARMGPEEAEALREKAAILISSGLLLDDTPAISISELRAKVAKHVAEGIQFVVVDYLQLMTGDNKGNREQEIGSISRGLKLIAKENNIPVIALAQLSRAVETRGGDKKPQLADLRESGSIEQDADLVIFLYRAEYYKITEDDMGNPTTDTTEVIFAKHRNGGLDSPLVRSVMRTGRYSDLEVEEEITSYAPTSAAAQRYPVLPQYTHNALPPSDFETYDNPDDNERPF